MPEIISFCFNPGPNYNIKYNEYIGNPAEAKVGIRMKKCKEYGVKPAHDNRNNFSECRGSG